MYITSYSIRIVLLSRYVNIYDTMAPMSEPHPESYWASFAVMVWYGVAPLRPPTAYEVCQTPFYMYEVDLV